MLADAARALRDLDDAAAFVVMMRQRLVDVHVLPREHREHRRRRVPVIRRGDGDDIDVAIIENPPKVLLEARLSAIV